MLFTSRSRHEPEEVTVRPAEPPPKPEPEVAGVLGDAYPMREYEALATELAFAPPQMLEDKLIRFLVHNDIKIFNYAAVDCYLAHHAEKVEKVWIWRPLRKRDLFHWEFMGREAHHQKYWAHGSFTSNDRPWCTPYQRAVPIEILRMVKLSFRTASVKVRSSTSVIMPIRSRTHSSWFACRPRTSLPSSSACGTSRDMNDGSNCHPRLLPLRSERDGNPLLFHPRSCRLDRRTLADDVRSAAREGVGVAISKVDRMWTD